MRCCCLNCPSFQNLSKPKLPASDKCLKIVLITAFVLSLFTLFGAAFSFLGGIGASVSGTWMGISGILTTGFLLLAIQTCYKRPPSTAQETLPVSSREEPSEDEGSVSSRSGSTRSEDELPDLETDSSSGEGVELKAHFAPRIFYEEEVSSPPEKSYVMPKEDPVLSSAPKKKINLPDNVDGWTKEKFADLTPGQVEKLIRQGKVGIRSELFSAYQVRYLFELIGGFESLISLKNHIPTLRPDQLLPLNQEILNMHFKYLTPYQIFNFPLSQVRNSRLANELLQSPHSKISPDAVCCWLKKGLALDPQLLTKEHIQGLFRYGHFQVSKPFLKQVAPSLDLEQIKFLVERTDLQLPYIPVGGLHKLTIRQANRIFTIGYDERVKEIKINVFRALIKWGWSSSVIKACSPKQAANICFETVNKEQLDLIFPTSTEEVIPESIQKMAAVSVENLKMLLKRELKGSWLILLSKKHVQSIDLKELGPAQIAFLFSSQHKDRSREIYGWLSEENKKCVHYYKDWLELPDEEKV